MLKRLVVRVGLAGLLLVVGLLVAAPGDTARTVALTILYTNDTHGHIRPYSFPETYDPDSPLAQLQTRRNIGGAARATEQAVEFIA